MAILNSDHLFEQADRLIAPPPHGRPRQVDLRRAISSAYHGLFHSILAASANEFVGAIHQKTPRYSLDYRSLDHKTLNAICADIVKLSLPPKYIAYVPDGGFGREIKSFAVAARELYQKRLRADYDPEPRFKSADALLAIRTAREAVDTFQSVPDPERRTFLTLLVCSPR